jgi:hypothetical protein
MPWRGDTVFDGFIGLHQPNIGKTVRPFVFVYDA